MLLTSPLADTFFHTLREDEAFILVRGPWISMVQFSHSLASFGQRWILGPTLNDEFTLQSSTTSRMGHCSLSFTALCRMGPALSTLLLVSTHHPQLEILLGYCDPYNGLEMHLFFNGQAFSLEHDVCSFGLTLSSKSLELWTHIDHVCQHVIKTGCLLDFSLESLFGSLDLDATRYAMILMAGSEPLSFNDFIAPIKLLENPWSWTRTPWTPSPPWTQDRYDHWLDALARLTAEPTLAYASRQAAATKAVLMTDQMARIDLNQAREAVILAMPIFFSSHLAFWTDALSQVGRDQAAAAFSLALSKTHTPLCHLFSAYAFSNLMLNCSDNAAELLLCALWGYSINEIEWLNGHCPSELSHFFERRILQDNISFMQSPMHHLQFGRL